jgi:hypothetical protein
VRLNSDQELRRDLLLFSLSKQSDLEAAIRMAAQMERFVLHGLEAGTQLSVDSAAGDNIELKEQAGCRAPEASGKAFPPSGREGADDSAAADEGTGGAIARVTKRRWSAEDDALLRRRWRSQRSLEEIAEELDRTVASLYSRARALGMPKRGALAAEDFAEAAAPNAAVAAASHPASCLRRHAPDVEPARSRQTGFKVERFLPPRRSGRKTAAGPKNADRKGGGSPCGRSVPDDHPGTGVEPIIHFLRSRDYSVVRVEEGRFRLDGRRILSADELREKANQVRKTLGQPPFGALSAAPVASP